MTSNPSEIRTRIIEMVDVSDEIIFYDPPSLFDSAIIGVGRRFGMEMVVVYDQQKVLENMAREFAHDTSYEDPMQEALEFFDYNTIGSWNGEHTPIFVTTLDLTLHQS